MRRAHGLISLLALGCTVDEIELVGRKCPCPPELECVNDVCVKPSGAAGSGGSSGSSGSGGIDGGAGSGGASCTPAITPANFRVAWETPNAIRWQWEPNGTQEAFAAYELVTAESTADVAAKSGTAVIWDVSKNPELGEYIFPDSSQLIDTVRDTITDGLKPKTTYYAQLFAIDTSGCRFASSVVQSVTTDPPLGEIELFSDANPPETFPAIYALSTDGPLEGAACLAYVQPACTPPNCYENLKAQGMSLSSTGMSENQFATKAYLELSVAIDGPVHSYWSQIWLMLSANSDIWKLEPIVARADGQYRSYQIPLRFLLQQQTDLPMTHTTFAASGIAGFNFGGNFVAGKRVRVDEASVKW